MEHITVENIEKEIQYILEHKPLTCDNLERFVLLCRAMKYLGRMHNEFTEEDAKEWAKLMNPTARWTMDQTTAVMHQNGFNHKPCEFWITMNMLYSDYGKTMTRFSMDKPEVWAAMAHDFLDDPDARPDKLGRYWRDIVKH